MKVTLDSRLVPTRYRTMQVYREDELSALLDIDRAIQTLEHRLQSELESALNRAVDGNLDETARRLEQQVER